MRMRRQRARWLRRYDKIQQAEPQHHIANQDGYLHAILFNAEGEGRHAYDVEHVYQCLLHADTDPARIRILEGEGDREWPSDTAPADKHSLEKTVDKVRREASPTDRLLVYVTNHGDLHYGSCCVETCDGYIWDYEFGELMQDLPVNFALFYFSQCFSGGFAREVGYDNGIGMASTSLDDTAMGNQRRNMGAYFTYQLFPTLLDPGYTIESAFDQTVEADTSLAAKLFTKRRITDTYPCFNDVHIPQLRWQDADPSNLYMGLPPKNTTELDKLSQE